MKTFASLFFAFLLLACASTQVQEIQESECDRMLWRPDLNKAIQMFCLGDEFWDDNHTKSSRLIAEAYHPEGKGVLFTLWDDNGDCIVDTTVVYLGEKMDGGRYLYEAVDMMPGSHGLMAIHNTEEKYGVKVLREVPCLKK